MKIKTIKHVIRKKFNEFVNSIDDKEVQKLVRKNAIITGGCFASLLLKEKVNDYDIYFRNIETVRAVSNYYIDKFRNEHKGYDIITVEECESEDDSKPRFKIMIKSDGVATDEGFVFTDSTDEITDDGEVESHFVKNDGKKEYKPVFLSTNAITLSDKIQLIIRFYGEPEEIHDNYDFIHCMNYWTPKEGLVLKNDSLAYILTRELKYVGSKYPVASVIRMRKFIKRGWSITAGEILKMVMQISQLDLYNFKVLEDQLTGVDASYFKMMLDAIPKDKIIDGRIDNTYIMSMIMKFF